jgi:hypothetical protein
MCASNDNHAGISNSPLLVQIHLPATANTRVMQKEMLSGSCYYDTRRCTERWRCSTLYLLRRARRSPSRRVAIPTPKSTWTGFLLTLPRPNQKPVFPSRSPRKCRESALTLFWEHSKNWVLMWKGTNPDLPKPGRKLQALCFHKLLVLANFHCFPIRLHPISEKCHGWMVSQLMYPTSLRSRVPAIAVPVSSISAHGNTRTHPQAVFLHSRYSKMIGTNSRTSRTPAQAEQTRLILHQAMHPILRSTAYQNQTVSLEMNGSIHSFA